MSFSVVAVFFFSFFGPREPFRKKYPSLATRLVSLLTRLVSLEMHLVSKRLDASQLILTRLVYFSSRPFSFIAVYAGLDLFL